MLASMLMERILIEELENISFRVDAGLQIGMGHLSRCLQLAKTIKQLKPSISIHFLSHFDNEHQEDLVLKEGFSLFPWKSPEDFLPLGLAQSTNSMIVFDHYKIDKSIESKFLNHYKYSLVIDDLKNREHICNYLIDTTLNRRKQEYVSLCPKHCSIFTGSNYAIMDSSFYQNRQKATTSKRVQKILCVFGGNDMSKMTLKIINAIKESNIPSQVEFSFFTGNDPIYYQKIKELLETTDIIYKLSMFTKNLSLEIAQSDLVIGAAGISAYEICAMRKPSILFQIADNQEDNLRELTKMESIYNGGNHKNFSNKNFIELLQRALSNLQKRSDIVKNAAKITDGRGKYRILISLWGLRTKTNDVVQLTPMNEEHKQLLYSWQTSDGIRKYFKNPTPPTWEEHCTWFDKNIDNPDVFMYSINVNESDTGYLRLNIINENEALISILIAPKYHKNGIASAALYNISILHPEFNFIAEIDSENLGSIHAFKKAGYKKWKENLYKLTKRGS